MPLPLTALYGGLAALLVIYLGMRIPGIRRRKKVGLGDGGDPELLSAMRMHGNAVETVPLAIILLGLAEGLGANPYLLHGLGAALLIGRVLHALGLAGSQGASKPRVIGMVLTWSVMIALAVTGIVLAITAL